MEKSLLSNQYYQCTTHIKFLRSEVISEIYTLIRSKENCLINDIYDHLRVHFNVSSFNRNNLMNLLLEEFNVSNSGIVSIKNTSNRYISSIKSFDNFKKLRDSILNMSYYSSDNSDKSSIDELLSELKSVSNVESIEIDEDNQSIRKAFEQYVRNAAASNNSYNFTYFNKKEFEKIYSSIIETKKKKILLRTYIDIIHDDFKDIQIGRILLPYDDWLFGKPIGTKLKDLNDEEKDDFIDFVVKNEFYSDILKSLDRPKKELIINAFLQTFEDKVVSDKIDVLIRRGKKQTLEEIGKSSNVTRERVRQIESSVINSYIQSFNSADKKNMFQVLRLIVINPLFVQFDEIVNLMEDYSYAFLHILCSKQIKELDLKNIIVYEEINTLNLTKVNWYSEVDKNINKLEDIVIGQKLKEFIRKLKEDLFIAHVDLPEEAYYKIVSLYYKKYGNVYSRIPLYMLERYRLVIREYYKNGLHIYDEDSLNDFRKKYYELFEDEEIFKKENRAISVRISDIAVQVDRGIYNIEENTPILNENIATKIKQFIDDGPPIILTLRIFNQFEEELKTYGIDNRYILHAMLKRQFIDDLYFKRDFVSKKGPGYRVIDELEKYIENHKGVFNVDELNSIFPTSNAITVLTYLSSNPEYIPISNRNWIKFRDIDITTVEIEMFKTIIKNQIEIRSIITAKHVIEEAGLKMNDFFKRNNINYPYFLFGILRSMFGDEFRFERPFISEIYTVITKGPNRIKEYIREYEQITISEIADFAQENDLRLYSMLEFIQSIRKDYLWADEDLLVATNQVEVNDELLSIIKYYLEKTLMNREAVNLKKMNYSIFPNFNLTWNKHLLASIINNYLEEYEVINTTNMYFSTDFLVIKKQTQLDKKTLIERYS